MPVDVGSMQDLPAGAIRLVRADGKKIALFRTADGVFALDNQCPHEGYGLTQGEVRDGTVTCHWHNWKFRLDDGACVLGEEAVRSYPVTFEGDRVLVDVTDPAPEVVRPRLLQSLRRGIERDETGRIARDVVRLLANHENPAELVWEAVAYGAPRAEFGWGHALATATDCLAMIDRYDGAARAIPIVQAIASISEVELRRPLRPQPPPATELPADAAARFRQPVEAELLDDAEALVRRAIEDGVGRDELRRWFIAAVSDHHLGYGHMAIYTQKAFSMLDVLGWDRAATVLPHLVPAVVYGTREDKLPYMRPFMRALAAVDVDALATTEPDPSWEDDGRLRTALLGRDKTAPLDASVAALREGAGVEGVLDAVALAVSERLLRFDPTVGFDHRADFGWLDITHGLTHANAARWAWRCEPGVDSARLALFAAFLAHYTGRHEWHADSAPLTIPPDTGTRVGDLQAAVEGQLPDEAVAFAMGLAPHDAAAQLERAALADRASSFIVAAHFVKTAHAAALEAETTGSSLPLAGTARFMSSPRLERFVQRNTLAAIDFVGGRLPADA